MRGTYSELIETQIDVADLEIGMHVTRLDRSWEETDFLVQGFVINHMSEIHALRRQCDVVVVQGVVKKQRESGKKAAGPGRLAGMFKRKQTDAQAPKPGATRPASRKRVSYMNQVSVGREMQTATMRFEEAQSTAKSIMSGLRISRTLDINNARTVVNSCVESVLRNENALMLLTKIKNQDEYTAEHCINVSILAAAFGKSLGLMKGEIQNLALCGLLHDVGKVRIPNEVLNKPSSLTDEEFALMRNHTVHGRAILMSTGAPLKTAVDVAFCHHERVDGKGYPRGLPAENIPYFAKIIALVDTYDAITSKRVYQKALASMHALDIIYNNRGTQFDTELADAFIQMVGIYPPGSIVEMVNGEVGIVVESHAQHKLKPKVLMVRDANKAPICYSRVLDLQVALKDDSGMVYQIAKEVPDGTYDIVLQDFVRDGLIVTTPLPENAHIEQTR
ncbi:MAG TPA: HD-GYP domain-containing protein [Marinobacter sp.]|uniref:HD-GYP domain-containing protein n=2 Tax=root TaxID=1 RepID=A0A831VV87_9GAMM|nr:HD-GYP domain-containing protein [Marinobacter antarcticus]HDZ37831.1 HD-GYP domain-containing protein [Marinobacter sp.]HEA51824.1 HD-GYP domain-containing protein [Marinobacter antarcticus]